MSVQEPRRFLQCLKHMAFRGAVSLRVQQFGQPKVNPGRIGRIKLQEGVVRLDRLRRMPQFLVRQAQEAIGRGNQRVDRQISLPIGCDFGPVAGRARQLHQPEEAVHHVRIQHRCLGKSLAFEIGLAQTPVRRGHEQIRAV